MTRSSIALFVVAGLSISANALAGTPPITPNSRITFSFADPAPGKQLIVSPGQGSDAVFSYDQESPINFIVGSNDGSVPTTVFEHVYLDMHLDAYANFGAPGGGLPVVTGAVGGSFTVYAVSARGRADILHAELPAVVTPNGVQSAGGFLTLVGLLSSGIFSGSIISSSDAFTLDYKAGPLLSDILDPLGIILAPRFDGVFTITDLALPATPCQGCGPQPAFGNASFSGTAALIPTSGTAALLGLSGLISLRRRR